MLIGVYKDKDGKPHYGLIDSLDAMDPYKDMPYCVVGEGTLELKDKKNEIQDGVFYDQAEIVLNSFRLKKKFMKGKEIRI